MTRFGCTAVLVLAATVCHAQTEADPALAQLEREVLAAWDAAGTVTCTVELETALNLSTAVVPARGSGPFEYKKDNGKHLARLDLVGSVSLPIGDIYVPIPQEVSTVFDGTAIHTVTAVALMPIVMEYDASEDKDVVKSPLAAMFKSLHEHAEVRLEADATVAGMPVHVIYAKFEKPDPDAVIPAAALHLYFARDSKLPAGVQAFDAAGKRIAAAAFRDVKTGADVSSNRFQFTPPEGFQHIEFSDVGTKLLPGAPP